MAQQQHHHPQHAMPPHQQQQMSVPVQQQVAQGQHQPMSTQQVPNAAASSLPEPEMCTTCPNCQTTIYLVRGADVGGQEMTSPPPSSGHTMMAQHQQQMVNEAMSNNTGIPMQQPIPTVGGN